MSEEALDGGRSGRSLMGRRGKALLRGVPLILLAVVLWREKPWTADISARAPWAIAAAILLNFTVCLPLKAARWRIALWQPPPFRQALAATLEGLLAGAAVGFGSGDLVRAARIQSRERALAIDYACTWAERGAEALALALLVLVIALVTAMASPLGPLALGLSGLVVVGYPALLGVGRSLAPRLARWPRGQRVLSALVRASTPRRVAAIVALSLLGWTAEGVMLLLFQSVFGLEVSIRTAALTLVGINAAIAIPLAPGNFGTFEAGAALALVAAGAPREVAISYALTYHLTHVVPVALVAAGVYLARR